MVIFKVICLFENILFMVEKVYSNECILKICIYNFIIFLDNFKKILFILVIKNFIQTKSFVRDWIN